MTMNRRSFLTLVGAAAAGVAVARIPEVPKPVAQKYVPALDVTPAHPLTLHFLDSNMQAVGPVFDLPNDWWSISRDGRAYLKSAVTVESWSGPACVLWGIELRRGGDWVFRDALSWLGGGGVCPGDVAQIPCLSIQMGGDRLSAPAKVAMLSAALGLPIPQDAS